MTIDLVYNGDNENSLRIGDRKLAKGDTVTVAASDAKMLCERYGFTEEPKKKAKAKKGGE